jgi:hypothetical protein
VARMKAQYLGYAHNDDEPTGRTAKKGTGQPVRKLKPHYHLAFLARVPGREDVKGAISAAVLPFLAKARDEGVPVWLEATDPHAVAVYEHYGFRVCEVVIVGVGRVAGDGWPKEGGEGVKWWGMLWDGKSVCHERERTTCTTVHFCVDWAVFNTGRGPVLTKNMMYIKRVAQQVICMKRIPHLERHSNAKNAIFSSLTLHKDSANAKRLVSIARIMS